MTRYWMLLLTLLMTLAPPLQAQRATYPKECTLTYIARPTTPDSTKARCIADRARVDLYNATVTYNKADSVENAALVKLATARVADSVAKVQYALVMKKYEQPPPVVASSVAIHSNGETVKVGEKLQLYSEVKDAAGNVLIKPVQWSGSSLSVADISGTGVLTGKSAGTVVISAKADAIIAQRTYSVTAAQPPPDTTTPPDTVKPPPSDTTPPSPTPVTIYPVPLDIGSGGAAVAALPRDTVDARYPATTRTVKVAAGANLQTAINAAAPGDVLALAPGSVFTGGFMLPKHAGAGVATCSGWVVIRTDISDAALGAEGTRMTPTRSAALSLARIQNADNQQAIGTAVGVPNVGCWRLDGLEIATGPAGFDVNGLVRFGDYAATDSTKQAHHIIVARSYVHGVPIPAGITNNQQQGWPGSIRRCFAFYSRYNAVVDSWAEKCRGGNGDSQTIIGYPGTGPYLVRNNHLSGGTEVIMSGGATSGIVGAVPSDWQIHGNYITRELADTLTLVKNLFEIKNAERVDFAGNVTRMNWANGQVGYGWLVKSVNQSSGACTWCRARDITIRYSTLTQSGAGMNLAGIQEAPAQPAARYTIYHVYLDSLGFRFASGANDARPYQVLGGSSLFDLILAYNTLGATSGAADGKLWGMMAVSGVASRVAMFSNIWWCGGYGAKGDGTGSGTVTFTTFLQPYTWSSQALYGCTGGYPPSTTYSTSRPTNGGAVMGNLLNGVVVPR